MFLYIVKQFWTLGPILKGCLALWLRFPRVWARGDPFRTQNHHFGTSPKRKHLLSDTWNLDLGLLYVLQREKFVLHIQIYATRIQIICLKNTNYMFQRYKFYIADTQLICSTYRISILEIHTLFMSETEISVHYIHRICISVCYIHRICII